MATTSVKLSEAGKECLDRLQAKLVLLGYKFTKEEVLELALRSASRRIGDLLAESDGGVVDMSEAEARKFTKRLIDRADDWGPTSWRDIDEILYGWKRK